jgi:hypothetical protein
MGAPDRRTVLPARIGQTQTRSRARSRLARQNRCAIASWDNPVCPHAPHTCAVVSPSSGSDFGSDREDWASNSVVMNLRPDFGGIADELVDLLARTSERCAPGAG